MAASSSSESEAGYQNQFLTEVTINNKSKKKVIVSCGNADKASFFRKDPVTTDYLRGLDENYLSKGQKKAFIEFEVIDNRQEVFSLNHKIPLLYGNITKIIREKHTPGFCEDNVLIENNIKVDAFLRGAFNVEIKKIIDLEKNDMKKYMVFLSLNSEASKNGILDKIYRNTKLNISDIIYKNNVRIDNKEWDQVVNPEEVIKTNSDIVQNTVVGEINIIISPNYVINFYSSINPFNIVKYFIKMSIYTNTRSKNNIVTKLIPVFLKCVEKNTYNHEKYDLFYLKSKKIETRTAVDTLIAIPFPESVKNIDFPIYSIDDILRLSLIIVTSENKFKILSEECNIQIGSVLSSDFYINGLFIPILDFIKKYIISKELDLKKNINQYDNALFKNTKEFFEYYHDTRLIEKRVPILTPLELSDIYQYINIDNIKKIIEGNKHLLNSSNTTIIHSSHDLRLNSRIWVDLFWETNNIVSKILHTEWLNIFNDLSTKARNLAYELYYKRDLLFPASNLPKYVFQRVIDDSSFIYDKDKLIRQYMILKIYKNIIETEIDSDSTFSDFFHLFDIPSDLYEKIEQEIESNQEYKRFYREEYLKVDILQKINQKIENVKDIAFLKKIPISVILTDLSIEISISSLLNLFIEDQNSSIAEEKIFPPTICSDIIKSLSILNNLNTNSFSKTTLTINVKLYPEFKKYQDEKEEEIKTMIKTSAPFFDTENSFLKFFGASSSESSSESQENKKNEEFVIQIISFKNI